MHKPHRVLLVCLLVSGKEVCLVTSAWRTDKGKVPPQGVAQVQHHAVELLDSVPVSTGLREWVLISIDCGINNLITAWHVCLTDRPSSANSDTVHTHTHTHTKKSIVCAKLRTINLHSRLRDRYEIAVQLYFRLKEEASK